MTDSSHLSQISNNSHYATSKKAPPEPTPSPFPPGTSDEVLALYKELEILLELCLKASGRKSWGPPYKHIGKDIDWSRENKNRCLWCTLAIFICLEIAWALMLDHQGKRPLVTPPAMQQRRPPDLVGL